MRLTYRGLSLCSSQPTVGSWLAREMAMQGSGDVCLVWHSSVASTGSDGGMSQERKEGRQAGRNIFKFGFYYQIYNEFKRVCH